MTADRSQWWLERCFDLSRRSMNNNNERLDKTDDCQIGRMNEQRPDRQMKQNHFRNQGAARKDVWILTLYK